MESVARGNPAGMVASLMAAVSVAIAALAMPTMAAAETQTVANPCAANPRAGKNPCAANPCAANPCAANPCAPAAAAKLSDAEAAAAYDRVADQLRSGYARSGRPVASAYFQWTRYNRVPYISETHGGRHVNNYANDVARAYGRFEKAGVMPVGSVVAKDSFRVAPGNPCAAKNPCAAGNPCAAKQPCAAQAGVQPGPLFVMEKMKAGFSPATGDWRYTMIMPDGAVFGTTKGKGAANVKFCAACHGLVGKAQDALYFLPEEYRGSPGGTGRAR